MNTQQAGGDAPAAARWFGFGGLVPFIGLAALAIGAVGPGAAFWLHALQAYGAVIVSFVGALHWAYAVRRAAAGADAWLQYGWSIVPALGAWGSLLLPPLLALPLQAVLLAACYAADRWLGRLDPVPGWMPRLRARLTAVAATALLLAAVVAR